MKDVAAGTPVWMAACKLKHMFTFFVCVLKTAL